MKAGLLLTGFFLLLLIVGLLLRDTDGPTNRNATPNRITTTGADSGEGKQIVPPKFLMRTVGRPPCVLNPSPRQAFFFVIRKSAEYFLDQQKAPAPDDSSER